MLQTGEKAHQHLFGGLGVSAARLLQTRSPAADAGAQSPRGCSHSQLVQLVAQGGSPAANASKEAVARCRFTPSAMCNATI
jgi:hypothetical protein